MGTARRTALCLLLALTVILALSGHSLETSNADAPRYRDAVIDPYDGYLYLAAYNQNEVHQVDLRTEEVANRAQVGQGPMALALDSEAGVLAAVNRLSGTLSLLQLPELREVGLAECGPGATAITALPTGGFAVANSFNDTITLVDPGHPDDPETIHDVLSVPIGIAASEEYIVVATMAPAAVLLYPIGHDTPEHTVSLDSAPIDIAYADDSQFVVATRDGLALIDARSASIVASVDTMVESVVVEGNRILALAADFVLLFGRELDQQGHIQLREEAQSFTAGGDLVIALSPAQQRWHIHGVFDNDLPLVWDETPTVPDPIEPELRPRPALEPIMPPEEEELPPPQRAPEIEATPLPPATRHDQEHEGAPLPEVREAEPLDNPSGNRNSPSNSPPDNPSNPGPTMDEPTNSDGGSHNSPSVNSEPANASDDADETDVEEPRPIWRAPGITPMAGADVVAPAFSREPPGMPLIEREGRTLADAISQGLQQAFQEDGFEQPDWTQPFRDIEGDRIQRRAQEITAEGNVRLSLDTIDFSADQFHYNQETGELRAEGNVIIRQEDSVLTAQRIAYHVPPEVFEEIQDTAPAPLTPNDRAPAMRHALSMGILDAEQVFINEPFRQISAVSLRYDFARQAGCIEGLQGSVGGLFFGVEHLEMRGPESGTGEDAWFSTCDHDIPHYRVRLGEVTLEEGESIRARGLQLQLGNVRTPLYWPYWAHHPGRRQTMGFDFDSGRAARIGYYFNYGQHFLINENIEAGLRLYPTEKAGVGFGLEGTYDFTHTPTSPLFMGQGQLRSMVTTKESGHIELYHQHILEEDTRLLLQAEQWFDRDFLKDFYYDEYRHRTAPRTFANVTHTRPDIIATGTYRQTTHNFIAETERLPEASFHILERPLFQGAYFSYDGVVGYNVRQPAKTNAFRAVNIARFTLDFDLHEALGIVPFAELDATFYSSQHRERNSGVRISTTVGTTFQTRFHRTYPGAFGFSAFKHVIVPSMTVSYRPSPTMGVDETPRFDAYDNVYGRSRVESRIENVVFGRDAKTNESWQVARLSIFQGHDFWNELRRANQIELELDIRPRPWWGILTVAERHRTSEQVDIDSPFSLQRRALATLERVFGRPVDPELLYRFNAQYADYERILSYVYFDDTVHDGRFNARMGFAYTKTRDQVFNREILYGMGYRFGEKWSAAFEHRYDFDRGDLYRQTYELRRNLHCWEAAIRFRDRTQGWDVGFEMSLVGIPGARVAF